MKITIIFSVLILFCTIALYAQTDPINREMQNSLSEQKAPHSNQNNNIFYYPVTRDNIIRKIDALGNITAVKTSQIWDGGMWLNSLKLTSSYDSKDRLYEQLDQDWGGSSWTNQNRYLFNYGNNDSLSEKISQYWGGSNWESYERLYYLYDAAANVTEQGRQNWESGVWVNEDRTLFTYDANNNITEEVDQLWFVNDWLNQSRNAYTYDLNANLTELLQQSWTNSTWQNFKRYSFTYNPDNTLSEEIYQTWDGVSWLNNTKKFYVYTSALSYELVQQYWNSSLSIWVNAFKTSYSLNSNSSQLQILVQAWNGTSFENQYLTSYSYDFNNNVKEWVEQDWGGSSWLNNFRASYTYSINNLLVEELVQDGNGTVWINDFKADFYYDASNRRTGMLQLNWDGTEWVNSARDSITYSQTLTSTVLTMNVPAGSQVLEVASTTGFSIGDNILINSGGLTEETNSITGFGSIHLQSPLQFNHNTGEVIEILISTSVEDDFEIIASEYSLSQNYPNPFNPYTSIEYIVGSREFVSLKVYDVLGNEVVTLVNGEQSAGTYEIEFDAAGLSSGIYFYKLQAGSFVETKKMILLR